MSLKRKVSYHALNDACMINSSLQKLRKPFYVMKIMLDHQRSRLLPKRQLANGDVLLASAFTKLFCSHLMDEVFTPFLINGFQKSCNDDGSIPISDNSNPFKILTTEAEVAQWNADSLPAGAVSTENGSILCNTSRWPLIIDPQLQGIRSIKKKESHPETTLEVVRLGQKDIIRKLELALETLILLKLYNIAHILFPFYSEY